MSVSTDQKKKSIAAIVIGCLAILIFSTHAFHSHAPLTPCQASGRQGKTGPYGPDGRDIRHAGQMLDVMYDSLNSHVTQMAHRCDKLHLERKERSRLIWETHDAGQAAIKKVSDADYTIPFEPHYPPLPQ